MIIDVSVNTLKRIAATSTATQKYFYTVKTIGEKTFIDIYTKMDNILFRYREEYSDDESQRLRLSLFLKDALEVKSIWFTNEEEWRIIFSQIISRLDNITERIDNEHARTTDGQGKSELRGG